MTATLTALALGATLFTGSAPAAPEASLWEKTQDAMFAQSLVDDGGYSTGFGDEYDDAGDRYDIMASFGIRIDPSIVPNKQTTQVFVTVPNANMLPGRIGSTVTRRARFLVRLRHKRTGSEYTDITSFSLRKQSATTAWGTFRASWNDIYRSQAGTGFVEVELRSGHFASINVPVR